MNSLIRVIIAVAALVCVAQARNATGADVTKLVVKPDGVLYVAGEKVDDCSPEHLTALLQPIKEKGGRIWWYCGEPQKGIQGATNANIHPVARRITDLALKMKIPIKRFAKEDFSEYVGLDGKVHKNGWHDGSGAFSLARASQLP